MGVFRLQRVAGVEGVLSVVSVQKDDKRGLGLAALVLVPVLCCAVAPLLIGIGFAGTVGAVGAFLGTAWPALVAVALVAAGGVVWVSVRRRRAARSSSDDCCAPNTSPDSDDDGRPAHERS